MSSASGATSLAFTYNTWGQRVAKLAGLPESPSPSPPPSPPPDDSGVPPPPAGSCSKAYGGELICQIASGTSSTAAAAASAGVVFFHDLQGRLLGEYDASSGAALREYLWLDDLPVAVLAYEQASLGGAPPIFVLHTDHLGAPRVALDRAGWQSWSWIAEPFGHSAPVTNPVGRGDFQLHLRMPGQYFDVETGLTQNWHREYDTSLGRYTQSDPIGLEGGINTYVYVEGDPISLTDPDGLQRGGGGPRPSAPVGSLRSPIEVRPGTNSPGAYGGQPFSGHAFDRLQGRGIPPSAVIDALAAGQRSPGSQPNTVQIHEPMNNITVVINATTGNVITVRSGPPSQSCGK